MKIAVTGASGHLGSAIIKALITKTGKENIIGITRTPANCGFFGVEIRKADYNDIGAYEAALQNVDILMMVSGMDIPEKRVAQHRNVIAAAKMNGVRKILFTSFMGKVGDSSVDNLINSYRQTEQDIRESGLEWSIGRDGLYIEPDVEYVKQYSEAGEIVNCAGKGRAPYVARDELAEAYSRMISNNSLNGKIFHLFGNPLTQEELAHHLNKTFKLNLSYREISPEEFLEKQVKTNGEYLGSIVAGLYLKIRNNQLLEGSDFEAAAGRPHINWNEYFEQFT